MIRERKRRNKITHVGMIIGKSVVDAHVLEIPFNVPIKEPLNFTVVVLRINKDGTNVGLDDIG